MAQVPPLPNDVSQQSSSVAVSLPSPGSKVAKFLGLNEAIEHKRYSDGCCIAAMRRRDEPRVQGHQTLSGGRVGRAEVIAREDERVRHDSNRLRASLRLPCSDCASAEARGTEAVAGVGAMSCGLQAAPKTLRTTAGQVIRIKFSSPRRTSHHRDTQALRFTNTRRERSS